MKEENRPVKGKSDKDTKRTPMTNRQLELYNMMKLKGNIIRFKGGFWSYRDVEVNNDIPKWYSGTQTVKALEKKGYIKRAFAHHEEWRDERCLHDR